MSVVISRAAPPDVSETLNVSPLISLTKYVPVAAIKPPPPVRVGNITPWLVVKLCPTAVITSVEATAVHANGETASSIAMPEF
jgi:hypothetical protein